MATDDALTDKVKNYYNTLKSQNDLQTKACISDDKTVPKHIRKIFLMIHDEVNSRSVILNGNLIIFLIALL